MKLSGAQLVTKALLDENVRYSFGIPGTHNIELYDVLEQADFNPMLVTDEQSASFLADGFARSSGEIAVVNVVPGAGLTHAMSGIAEAYMDGVPMLVLACGIRNDITMAYQLHAVDQAAIARPVCKKTFSIKSHEEIYPLIRKAIALARKAPQGPVFVEVPANLYLFPSDLSDHNLTTAHDTTPDATPDSAIIEKIVHALNTNSSIGIYAGLGALHARKEIFELAETLDALVFSTVSGKGVFPENHARFAWNVPGAAAPKSIQNLAKEFDCLLAVGCRFGEVATASYGLEAPKNLIHIDIDENVFDKNYPALLKLKADATEALRAILTSTQLKKKSVNSARLAQLAEAHQIINKEQSSQISKDNRVSPNAFMRATQQILGPDTIYATDSGNGTFLAMEHLRLTKPRCFLGPIDYSCMGYSIPAAIGAKIANPKHPVVALAGDGAFLMTGMELITANTYNIGVIACVLNDGELSQIAQFQRRALGRESCTGLAPLAFDHLAKAFGIEYLSLKSDSEIQSVLARAKELSETGRPVLVEVLIDYSFQTYFTKGVLKTNLLRFPWKDRIRLISRVVKRKIFS